MKVFVHHRRSCLLVCVCVGGGGGGGGGARARGGWVRSASWICIHVHCTCRYTYLPVLCVGVNESVCVCGGVQLMGRGAWNLLCTGSAIAILYTLYYARASE